VIGRWPGNPHGVALRRDGPVSGFQVQSVPSPWLNRAMGWGDADAALVPAYAAWFAGAGIEGRFEVMPDRAGPALARALAAAGLLPTGGDAIVTGQPQPAGDVPSVTLATDEAAMETFLDTHLHGLGIPLAVHDGAKANMRGWRGLAGMALLLAWRDGLPAGSCVLHRADGIAYVADMATRPEHRRQGVQTDLLRQCHALAADDAVIWARCRFLSGSHRNLQRAGLATFCTTTFWTIA
jgi:GNAT superfamily N-acetyltransferase